MMFNLFKKKEPDSILVNTFCQWFIEKNGEIIKSVENNKNDHQTMLVLLDEVEAQLAKVYRTGYHGDIEFEYGFNKNINRWELNLFHMNNRFLIKTTSLIADILNEKLGEKWQVNSDS